MSTLKLDTLSNKAGTASVPSDTIVSGTAKAWVNFNGTGTVAIRRAFNVSSITDNGTGQYTVNFTTALTDANYVMSGSAGNLTGTTTAHRSINRDGEWTTSECHIRVVGSSSTTYDDDYVGVTIFS